MRLRTTIWTVIATGTLALAGCGSTSGGSSRSSSSVGATIAHLTLTNAWSGMGAKLADWEIAHSRSTADGCTSGCYGGEAMDSGSKTPQFKLVSTSGPPENRVDGYEQAIGENTSIAAAKNAVLELLPRDTRTTSYRVAHGEGSCVLWNVRSRTLARWFARNPHVGDPSGSLGVLLDTVSTSGEAAYEPNNVSHAKIDVLPSGAGGGC